MLFFKIYSMIIFCREQINYFKKSLSTAFTDLLDINELVVRILYENLMRDVKDFCEIHLDELYDVGNLDFKGIWAFFILNNFQTKTSKLNLNFLALTYRLNQFDAEICSIISYE